MAKEEADKVGSGGGSHIGVRGVQQRRTARRRCLRRATTPLHGVEAAMLRTVLRWGGAAMWQAALVDDLQGNLLRLSVAEWERSRWRRRDMGRDEFFMPMPESL